MAENKSNKQNENRKKELDFVTCPKHGVKYPAGSSCHRCDAENRR